MKLRPAVGALICLALYCFTPAHADSWRFEPKLERTETRFGDTRVVQIVDARENQLYPDFTVEFWRGKTLLARYPGMGFQEVHASPDRKIFVGLSNRGLPGSAVAIFGERGELRLQATHEGVALAYCDTSVTLVRRWYDSEDPGLEFTTDPEYGGTLVTLRDCRGSRVNLVELVLEAYRRAAERQGTASPDGTPAS